MHSSHHSLFEINFFVRSRQLFQDYTLQKLFIGPEANMQLVPESKLTPLILIPLAICSFHRPSALHFVIVGFTSILYISGINYRNYCNMAASVLLLLLITISDLEQMWVMIENYGRKKLGQTLVQVFCDYRVWAITFEMTFAVVAVLNGFYLYKKYRNLMLGIQEQ